MELPNVSPSFHIAKTSRFAGMVSDKSLSVTAPLVDVVDIAAIAAGLRKGSAVSGVSGDSSEGDGAEGGGRDDIQRCRQIHFLLILRPKINCGVGLVNCFF